jgi:hypothetical protein
MMQNRVSAQNIVFGNLDKNGAPKDAYASILLQKKNYDAHISPSCCKCSPTTMLKLSFPLS